MIPPLLMIWVFPVVALVLFRGLGWRAGLIWTILLGHLFLPTRTVFDLPLLPALNKYTIPSLSALLALMIFMPRTDKVQAIVQPGWLPADGLSRVGIFMLVFGAFLTVATNTDTLVYGPKVINGLRLYDGFAEVMTIIMLLLPMLLARKYLATDDSHRILLQVLCIAGLIYSLPILYEVRMSPQLNRIFYGFFPNEWKQHLRDGGYRPLVFMKHGLILAIFTCCATLAAFGYARAVGGKTARLYLGFGGWLLLVLIASNSLTALAAAVVMLPVIMFLTLRTQLMWASIIAGIVLLYPMLRGADLVPTDLAVQWADSISPDRANSLKFRLANEDKLLEKANQRPLFGWGGWNRARVFNDQGRDTTTTDGSWIIQIGQAGWIGYLGQFGLLCVPIILLFLRSRRLELTLASSALALILSANLIDLIPNSGLTPVTWLISGALIGRLERRRADDDVTVPQSGPAKRRAPRYTRYASRPSSAALQVEDTHPTVRSTPDSTSSRTYSSAHRRRDFRHQLSNR